MKRNSKFLVRITCVFLLLLTASCSSENQQGLPNETVIVTNNEQIPANTKVYKNDYFDLAEYDVRYKWIHCFLSGNASGCASIAHVDPDAYSFIQELKFEDYSVTEIDNYTTEFYFSVIGGKENLPDGEYTYIISSGPYLSQKLVESKDQDIEPLVEEIIPFCSEVKKLDKFDETDNKRFACGIEIVNS